MYNYKTFWDNTQGVATLIKEGNFDELVLAAKDRYDNWSNYGIEWPPTEPNFNDQKTAYFVRFHDYAIRVAKHWGEVGNCKWVLDKKATEGMAQMAIIKYADLGFFPKHLIGQFVLGALDGCPVYTRDADIIQHPNFNIELPDENGFFDHPLSWVQKYMADKDFTVIGDWAYCIKTRASFDAILFSDTFKTVIENDDTIEVISDTDKFAITPSDY